MARLPLVVSPFMNQQDQRPKIFFSHIHEEAALGKIVKDGLEDAFAKQVAVFVSSDRRDNPRWGALARQDRARTQRPADANARIPC